MADQNTYVAFTNIMHKVNDQLDTVYPAIDTSLASDVSGISEYVEATSFLHGVPALVRHHTRHSNSS